MEQKSCHFTIRTCVQYTSNAREPNEQCTRNGQNFVYTFLHARNNDMSLPACVSNESKNDERVCACACHVTDICMCGYGWKHFPSDKPSIYYSKNSFLLFLLEWAEPMAHTHSLAHRHRDRCYWTPKIPSSQPNASLGSISALCTVPSFQFTHTHNFWYAHFDSMQNEIIIKGIKSRRCEHRQRLARSSGVR